MRRLGGGLSAAMICLLGLAGAASAQDRPRGRPGGLVRNLADALIFRPPPSVLSGVETPASRMARYYQMGGGVGPMPGESNGPSAGFLIAGGGDIPGYSVPILPGAGPDPSLSGERRRRVIDRYQRFRSRSGLPPLAVPR